MKRISFAVVCFAFVGWGSLANEFFEKNKHALKPVQFHQAEALFDEGKYTECLENLPAIFNLSSVATNRGVLAEVYTLKAKCFLKTGNIQDALKSCDTAVFVSTSMIEARLLRTQIYKLTGDIEKADLDWAYLLLKGEALPAAYEGFGDLAFSKKKYLDAYIFYSKACSVDSNNAFLHFKKGRLLFMLGKLELAAKEFEIAYSLNHNLTNAYSSQWKNSLFSYFDPTESYNLRELYTGCLIEHAREIIFSGHTDIAELDKEVAGENMLSAIRYLDRAEEIGYPNRNVYLLRSTVYAYLGDLSMAEIDYNKFIEMLVAEPEFNLTETKIKTFSEIVPKTRRNVIKNLYLLTKAYPYKSWKKEQGSYGGGKTAPRDIW